MAGIGFELKKLLADRSLFGQVRAYAFAAFVTIGPMLFGMLLVGGVQFLLVYRGFRFSDRELMMAAAVYAFTFSTLAIGGLAMAVTRYVSDMLYLRRFDRIAPAFWGTAAVGLPPAAFAAAGFLGAAEASAVFKAAAYALFLELCLMWLLTIFLSALRDYLLIVRYYALAVGTGVVGVWWLLGRMQVRDPAWVLAVIDVALLVVLLPVGRRLLRVFPVPRRGAAYFGFVGYLRRYPSLPAVGVMLYASASAHFMVYWFGPEGYVVAGAFRVSPFYDLPAFYAFLTVLPAFVLFVVVFETAFYEKFARYYGLVVSGGGIRDLESAKSDLYAALSGGVNHMVKVQLMLTMIALAVGAKLLPAAGFTVEQMDVFNTLVFGYYFYIFAFFCVLVLLYFDDRRGALAVSATLLVGQIGLTALASARGYDGAGLLVSAFVALMVGLFRLRWFVRHLDYYTFCSQPFFKSRRLLAVGRDWLKKWRPRRQSLLALVAAAVLPTVSGCSLLPPRKTEPTPLPDPYTAFGRFAEDKRLYQRDRDDEVVTLYLTVLPTRKDGRPLTWYELNRISDRTNNDELEAIVQEGAPDGSGPVRDRFGYGETEANAAVGLRGGSTRYAPQKSYKIRLYDRAGLWRNQRVLNLNKHPYDATRIRNKLAFDLFEEMPDIGSLRTQFVHLYVKDLSEGADADETPFVDYGLFTHVEQPNRQFLKNHWLDPFGQLYKAVNFEFLRYPEVLKAESDPAYDRQAFETRLEIQGREEHAKLLRMLDAVNDVSRPFSEVFERHFDRDNYLTWVAANLLTDNMDTISQNFLLYSPLNSDKWYFLPWDYDGAWGFEEGEPSYKKSRSPWQAGIANYWSVTVHRRFFSEPGHVAALKAKLEQLAPLFAPDALAERVRRYRATVEPFLRRGPDVMFLPNSVERLEAEYRKLSEIPARRMRELDAELQKPMPVFLWEERLADGRYRFVWTPSYDLQGDALIYDWTLAADPAFERPIVSREGLVSTETVYGPLAPGTYFWRVVVRDAAGNRQVPFDRYIDERGNYFHGLRQLKVNG